MKTEVIRSVVEYLSSHPKEHRQVVAIDLAMSILDNIPATQVDISGILHCIQMEVDRQFNAGINSRKMTLDMTESQN